MITSFCAAIAGKSTPGISGHTLSAQHVKRVVDFGRRRSDQACSRSVDNLAGANGIPLADHRYLLMPTMHVLLSASYALIYETLQTLRKLTSLITLGVGDSCAINVRHCCQFFARVPQEETSF